MALWKNGPSKPRSGIKNCTKIKHGSEGGGGLAAEKVKCTFILKRYLCRIGIEIKLLPSRYIEFRGQSHQVTYITLQLVGNIEKVYSICKTPSLF